MKTSNEWIVEIEFEILRLKLNNRHVYYMFSADMVDATAKQLEIHFKAIDGLSVEIRKCHRCSNKHDIIIDW